MPREVSYPAKIQLKRLFLQILNIGKTERHECHSTFLCVPLLGLFAPETKAEKFFDMWTKKEVGVWSWVDRGLSLEGLIPFISDGGICHVSDIP